MYLWALEWLLGHQQDGFLSQALHLLVSLFRQGGTQVGCGAIQKAMERHAGLILKAVNGGITRLTNIIQMHTTIITRTIVSIVHGEMSHWILKTVPLTIRSLRQFHR